MKIRRNHGRVRDELPPEIRQQVDRLMIEGGVTYDDIKAYLDAQGYDISRSAIGRYGKDFLATYQRLKIIEDKSRALVSEAGDGMVLEEAASKLFAQMILEAQMSGELDIKELPRIVSDFAKLQSSVVSRERLKKDFAEKVQKTAADVVESVRGKGLSEEAAEEIRKKILGISR
ncbi:phage protein Gp27 family protein [Desulfatiglans anilini]|uniref:phage protein Gp27 family protein n=1 Tax=Desulfatiglans anilini TaxID=90728 RepID=UPI00040FE511|nr:phage protein Gp27 family protein [Desulfatiglans anilini]